MSCCCKCFVTLPHGAMGWYVVCDCGISLSYSLKFWPLPHSAVVYSLFVVTPVACGGLLLGPCFVLEYFVSFLVLQSSHMGRRELVDLLLLLLEDIDM